MEDMLGGATTYYEQRLDETIQSQLILSREEGLPDVLDGVVVLKICTLMWKDMIAGYKEYPESLRNAMTEREFGRIFTKSTARVMSKYILDVPPPFDEFV